MHRITQNTHVQTLFKTKKSVWLKRFLSLWLVTLFIVWLVERTEEQPEKTPYIIGVSAIIALIAFLFTAIKDIWQYADNEKLHQFVKVAVVKKMNHTIQENDVHIINIQKGVVTIRVFETVYFIYQGQHYYSIYLVEIGTVISPNETIDAKKSEDTIDESEITDVLNVQDNVKQTLQQNIQANPKVVAVQQMMNEWRHRKNVTLSCGLKIEQKQQTIQFKTKSGKKIDKTSHRFKCTRDDIQQLEITLYQMGQQCYKQFEDYTPKDKNAYASYRNEHKNETVYLEQNGHIILINTPLQDDDLLYQFNRERLMSYLIELRRIMQKENIPSYINDMTKCDTLNENRKDENHAKNH